MSDWMSEENLRNRIDGIEEEAGDEFRSEEGLELAREVLRLRAQKLDFRHRNMLEVIYNRMTLLYEEDRNTYWMLTLHEIISGIGDIPFEAAARIGSKSEVEAEINRLRLQTKSLEEKLAAMKE